MNAITSIFVVLVSIMNTGLYACESLTGRKIIDRLINNQLDIAHSLLTNKLKQDSTDPMNGFYQGAMLWAKSGEGANFKISQQALVQLTKNLKPNPVTTKKHSKDTKIRLNKGMSQMLIARIYASRKQWIRAYRYGKAARSELQRLLKEYPNEKDVLLGLGLFEFYTGSVPNHLRWLTHLMRFSGDKQKGIVLVQNAVRQSPTLAPEAARVILTEIVNSDISQSCQYLSLSRTMRSKYRNNPQFSFAQQKILNACGYPELALKENQIASKQFFQYKVLNKLLMIQKLDILSNLGNVDEIRKFKGKTKQYSYHRELALGKAYDVRSQRKQAIEAYTRAQQLAYNSKGLDSNLSYLHKAYKKPSPQPFTNKFPLANGCG